MKKYHLKRETTTTTTESTSSTGTSTSTTHGRNSTRIVMNLETLKELYFEAINRPAPSFILAAIREDLEEAPELMYAYYSYALRETALAPRPSWKYTEAILARLRREKTPPEALPLW